MAEIKKLTVEELKKAVGGSDREKVGINCPACGCFICTDIEHIIQSGELVCPICGLHLQIDSKR